MNLYQKSRQYERPLLITLLLAAGVFTRTAQYLYNRSLWLDEAFLADNLLHRSYAGLLTLLSHEQGAPPGFLLTEKLFINVLGKSEYALRFLPLLMGIIAVFLVWKLAEHIAPQAIILTLALFAASNMLIYYSSEVKQYSGDVTTALVLWLVALYATSTLTGRGMKYHVPTEERTTSLILLALAGMIAVWFSHPALFVLAGIGSTILLRCLIERRWQDFWRYLVVCSLWGLSFLIAYFTLYRDLSQVEHLRAYWGGAFLRPEVTWLVKIPLEPFILMSGLKNIPLLVLLLGGFVIGTMKIGRWNWILLFSSMPFLLIASALEMYPYSGRFILMLMPVTMLTIAIGWQEILEKVAEQSRTVAMIAAALLVIFLFARVNITQETNEVRDLLAYIDANKQPGDVVVMHYRTAIIADYYQYAYIPLETITEPLNQPVWFGYLEDFDKPDQERVRQSIAGDRALQEVKTFTGVAAYAYR